MLRSVTSEIILYELWQRHRLNRHANSIDKMNFTKEQDIQDRHKQYRQDEFHQRTRHTR
jgi:hypothetical protein